jgi:predicted transposase/invertase (TIGR01784 family)
MMNMALSKNAEKIKKAYEELQYLSQDEKARAEFDAYMQWESDRKAAISYAKDKGIKQGEKNKTIEMVKELLKLNISIDIIMQTSKLTKERNRKN